jgi:hypothetical protein
MTRAPLLSIRFADGAYGIRDSSVGGMVPKMNAHAGAFSSDSGETRPPVGFDRGFCAFSCGYGSLV